MISHQTYQSYLCPCTDSIVQETTRLASGVFVVRYVQEDTHFTTSNGESHLVRKGDRIAVYPPAIHKDPEIYQNPYVSTHKHFTIFLFLS